MGDFAGEEGIGSEEADGGGKGSGDEGEVGGVAGLANALVSDFVFNVAVRVWVRVMGRSLRASKTGLAAAQKAFKLKGWTQDYLAGAAGCTRGRVINFLAQRPVDKQLFQTFCTELGLEWGEIAELEETEKPNKSLSIDELLHIYDQMVSGKARSSKS